VAVNPTLHLQWGAWGKCTTGNCRGSCCERLECAGSLTVPIWAAHLRGLAATAPDATVLWDL